MTYVIITFVVFCTANITANAFRCIRKISFACFLKVRFSLLCDFLPFNA